MARPPLPAGVTVRRYPVADLPDHLFASFAAMRNTLRALVEPHDAPTPAERLRDVARGYGAMPTMRVEAALACAGDQVVGSLYMGGDRDSPNRHLLQTDLGVLPGFRRLGLGHALLAEAVAMARRDGHRLLIGQTSDRDPDGEAFARSLGAEPGLAMRISELDLEVEAAPLFGPDGVVPTWLAAAPSTAPDYALRWLERPFDDATLEALGAVRTSMNAAPRGDLDVHDDVPTLERMRAEEAMHAARADEAWALVAVHRPTGAFAGVTQVAWQPHNPKVVEQMETGVLEAHRGHRLGRWLKAAMLDRIRRERPEARVVRTGNADVNAPMLAINEALGFRPARAMTIWQAEVDAIAAALG